MNFPRPYGRDIFAVGLRPILALSSHGLTDGVFASQQNKLLSDFGVFGDIVRLAATPILPGCSSPQRGRLNVSEDSSCLRPDMSRRLQRPQPW